MYNAGRQPIHFWCPLLMIQNGSFLQMALSSSCGHIYSLAVNI